METTSIYARLGQVMAEVKAVEKGQKNQTQNFMFRGIDDMLNAFHGLFSTAGIIILPHELEHLQENCTTAKGALQFRSRIHFAFDFVSTADGSTVTADGWGEAMDNGDKGYNKCKSIALKYVLMQMFLVPTRDIADPDKETPAEVVAGQGSDDLELMRDDIRRANDRDALVAAWRTWGDFFPNETKDAITSRRKELGITK